MHAVHLRIDLYILLVYRDLILLSLCTVNVNNIKLILFFHMLFKGTINVVIKEIRTCICTR